MDTIIIGSGPAGYTAAIYAARADLNPVMYTGLEPGGQLTTTTEVDNFPGFPIGVDGPTMMNELKEQAERFGTKVEIDFISKVDFSKDKGGIHKLYTQNGDEIKSKTVIILQVLQLNIWVYLANKDLLEVEFQHVQFVMVFFIKIRMSQLLVEVTQR